MKKYRLDYTDTSKFGGQTLDRVVALRDFGSVKAGDRGGYIAGEHNLSHEGNCWVADRAKVGGLAEIRDKARVSDNAKVSGNAQISGKAQIRGNARIRDKVWISDNAWICGNVWVRGNVKISGNAEVRNNAQISGDVQISDNVQISGYAQIYGNTRILGASNIRGDTELCIGTWEKSPIQIQGSCDWLYQSSPTHVCIGCEERHIDDWLELDPEIGLDHGYSLAEVDEYAAYLRLCKRLMDEG